MQRPRFFSHPQEQALLPEVMGVERFALQAAPLIKHRKYKCEISGFQSFGGQMNRSASGFMLLEFRDPRLQGPDARKSGNLRVVDELYYWSRHVDLAIKHKKGDLIFAPWFSQAEIISLFRIGAVIQEQSADESESKQFANSVLDVLNNLRNGELMVSALGLEGEVANWDQALWLKSLQMMQPKQKKQYMELFGCNLRFLPSVPAFREAIIHWGSETPDSSLFRIKAASILAKFKKHQSVAA